MLLFKDRIRTESPTMALHLTAQDREAVSLLLHAGEPKAAIARRLGKASCTIFRELKRNREHSEYRGCRAHELTLERRHRPRLYRRKMEQREIREHVFARLRQYWSPDQIAGRLRLECPAERWRHISRQTIYSFLARKENRAQWKEYLRGGRAHPARTEPASRKTGIASRPEVINRRERLGDWEGDTMLGLRWRSDGALVALVERRSGYLELCKVPDRRSETVVTAIRHRLGRHPPERRRSCTFDNGPEFTLHGVLRKKLQLETYFADPQCPWQRGTNENTIRLLRQFFPKGQSLRDIRPRQAAAAMERLNNRPRKRLGYRTPHEAFHETAIVAIPT